MKDLARYMNLVSSYVPLRVKYNIIFRIEEVIISIPCARLLGSELIELTRKVHPAQSLSGRKNTPARMEKNAETIDMTTGQCSQGPSRICVIDDANVYKINGGPNDCLRLDAIVFVGM